MYEYQYTYEAKANPVATEGRYGVCNHTYCVRYFKIVSTRVKFLIHFVHKNFLPGLVCFCIRNNKNMTLPLGRQQNEAQASFFDSLLENRVYQAVFLCFIGGHEEVAVGVFFYLC